MTKGAQFTGVGFKFGISQEKTINNKVLYLNEDQGRKRLAPVLWTASFVVSYFEKCLKYS